MFLCLFLSQMYVCLNIDVNFCFLSSVKWVSLLNVVLMGFCFYSTLRFQDASIVIPCGYSSFIFMAICCSTVWTTFYLSLLLSVDFWVVSQLNVLSVDYTFFGCFCITVPTIHIVEQPTCHISPLLSVYATCIYLHLLSCDL